MSEEREVFERVVPIAVSEGGDGRTIDARLVPYGVQATVADAPYYEPYTEEFLPGSFERQTKAPDRIKVWLNFEHGKHLRDIVGHGIALEERGDGLYGSFRVHPGPDGDKALAMIEEGVLTGMSIEFASLKSRVVNGVVQRVKAMVDKASLVMAGKEAYQGAGVLAVREAPEGESQPEPTEAPGASDDQTIIEEPGVPDPPPPKERSDVDEVLERVGYEPLISRVISKKPWDGSSARFSDEEYQRSCLIDRGGDAPVKERCSLPVLEPNGDINEHALGQAERRIRQTTGVSADLKSDAARKLIRYYNQAGTPPPASLRAMASW